MTFQQVLKHLGGGGDVFLFLDRGQFGKGLVGSRRNVTERTNAFGYQVHGRPQLRVLRHEHCVQVIELGTGHVPVVIVGLEIEGIGVGEYARERVRDALPVRR